MKLFLDTNIVLDVTAERQPFQADAERVVALVENRDAAAAVSAISYTTVHYVMSKGMGQEEAFEALRIMRRLFETVPCDADIIGTAMDSGLPDFEDAVQYFSALAAGAERIITRNVGHFPTDSVVVQTPAEFLAWWLTRKERKSPKR